MHRGGKVRSGKVKQRQFQTDRPTIYYIHVKTSPAQPSPAQPRYCIDSFFLTLYKDEATYKKKLILYNQTKFCASRLAAGYR